MNELLEWLLTHYGIEKFTPGLERVQRALRPYIKNLQAKRIVTIAGTNGKGETALRLSHSLSSFTLWTSPHIERITERFRSQNGEIELSELKKLCESCHEELIQNNVLLTFYEFLFFVFCRWSLQLNPEIMILEVGLGGRLDAVNVLDAECVLLPSISRDHQEFLGNRYDLILAEKMGVLREGTLFLHALDLNYLKETAINLNQKIRARLIDIDEMCEFDPFQFSERNQFLAYAAKCYLEGASFEELKGQNFYKSFIPQAWPLAHRGEVVRAPGDWVLYGSHNVDGMRKLIQFLLSETYNKTTASFDSFLVAFSSRSLSDVRTMLKMLKRLGLERIKVTTYEHPKALKRQQIEPLAQHEGLCFVPDYQKFVESHRHQKVLVAGSYYFLGTLRPMLR
jgi:dihydrofolate synthase / folylpolyglutamate synthase